jgi:flagellar hook assembly protein FlgD
MPEVFVFSTNNFPNPFNPETTIQFTIGNVENVILHVYNVRGQRVRTLLDGSREFETGQHSVVWDGTDDLGRSMSSGIYFYRITVGEDTAVRRMLLMK